MSAPSGCSKGSVGHVISRPCSLPLEKEKRSDPLSELAKAAQGRIRWRCYVLSLKMPRSPPFLHEWEPPWERLGFRTLHSLQSLRTGAHLSLSLSFGPPFPYRVLLLCFPKLECVFNQSSPQLKIPHSTFSWLVRSNLCHSQSKRNMWLKSLNGSVSRVSAH